MTRHLALLRGINVGGKNLIKMSELVAAMTNDGFANVKSYINSGNILFDANLEKDLAQRVKQSIKNHSGLDIDVALQPGLEEAGQFKCAGVEGLAVTRHGHAAPCRHIAVLEAGHPDPDAAGVAAGVAVAVVLMPMVQRSLSSMPTPASSIPAALFWPMVARHQHPRRGPYQALSAALMCAGAPR